MVVALQKEIGCPNIAMVEVSLNVECVNADYHLKNHPHFLVLAKHWLTQQPLFESIGKVLPEYYHEPLFGLIKVLKLHIRKHIVVEVWVHGPFNSFEPPEVVFEVELLAFKIDLEKEGLRFGLIHEGDGSEGLVVLVYDLVHECGVLLEPRLKLLEGIVLFPEGLVQKCVSHERDNI